VADKVTIKVEGVAEVMKNLKKYQFIKTEACKIALKRGAFNIERAAKEGAPVDTGRLRASISVNWSGSSMGEGKTGSQAKPGDGVKKPSGPKELVYTVGTNVIYAPPQEFGTEKRPDSGHPYLFPAYFMYEGPIVKDVGKVFKKDVGLK